MPYFDKVVSQQLNGLPSLVGLWNEAPLEEIVTVRLERGIGDRRSLLTTKLIHDLELVFKVSPGKL